MSDTQCAQVILDRLEIRQVVEAWALWRDSGMWAELEAAYTPDGRMSSGGSSGTIQEFIAFSKEFTRNAKIRPLHVIGSSKISVNGDRATAETRVTVLLRGVLHGIEADVTAYGRQFDKFLRHEGRWCIKERTPIYDRDRIDPVDPAANIPLDAERLAGYPKEYRHMSYFNDVLGIAPSNLTLPTRASAAEIKLYADGAAWLAGE